MSLRQILFATLQLAEHAV